MKNDLNFIRMYHNASSLGRQIVHQCLSCFLKRIAIYTSSVLVTVFLLSSCQKDDVLDNKNIKPGADTRLDVSASVPINGVMMQGFYWNTPKTTSAGTWWQNLSSKATELSQAGITAIWIPPAYKGGSSDDVGYGVYDRYDLGEFNQKGTVATRYGQLADLQSAITSFHNNNIQVYADIVMNHFLWADYQETVNGTSVWTGYSYSGRNNTYSSYQWNSTLFNGYQNGSSWVQWNAWDFQPYANGDAYDNLMGCEVRYNPINGSGALETINWGNWITTKLGLDGYRLDAVKHMYTPFVNSWLDNVKGSRFAVGEAWFNNLQNMNDYASSTGGRMSLFDVPLHYMFNAMSNGNGSWDISQLNSAGFTGGTNGSLSVSFVDNHDTDDNTGALYSPVANLKMLAYAYILTREKGYPCVFYRDYYEYGLGSQIKTLIGIRKANAYGAGAEYSSVNDADLYVYSRAGDATHPGLLVMLNDGSSTKSKSITTPFKSVTLTDQTGNTAGSVITDANGTATFSVNSRSYAVWVPTTGGGTTTTSGSSFVVHCKRPSTWGTSLKVYYWNQMPTGAMPTVAWPGTTMTAEGNDWYAFTFTGVTSTSLIFNDGTNQTADLTRNKDGWYKNSAWTDANPESTTNQAPVISVNPANGTSSSTAFNVTITGTDDSGIAPTLYYTTDGTTPSTTSGNNAAGVKVINVSSSLTLKVLAVDNQGLASAVSSYSYTITTAAGITAVTFNISYSNTVNGQDVYIVGSTAQLGSWNAASAIKLTTNPWPSWTTTINLTSGTYVEYKYIRKDQSGNVLWESGANKSFTPSGTSLTMNDTW